jgi:protein ImuB
MMHVCLWSPSWSIGEGSVGETSVGEPVAGEAGEAGEAVSAAGLALAELAPRIRVEREIIWADGRGLDARRLAARLLARLTGEGVAARAGVAAVPVAAELAARWGRGSQESTEGRTPFLVKERTGWGWRRGGSPAGDVPARHAGTGAGGRAGEGEGEGKEAGEAAVVVVSQGGEREWLGSLPVVALGPEPRLAALLEGVGVLTIGALAALEREAVEVRLGAEAVALWRLARADDRRLLFLPVPPERPHGSIDFVDYVLTDPARLLFTANALLGPLCERLTSRGEHARTLRLVLPLANGAEWERAIRPARPTASRETWLRLIRGLLERLTVPDAVVGMRLEMGATEPAAVRQGDLFDRGFATAAAVEVAVARLAERALVPVEPEVGGHSLVERRGKWIELRATNYERRATNYELRAEHDAWTRSESQAGVALQLLSKPRRLEVKSVTRRDHEVPARLRDRSGWREVAVAAGPDRISGGQWEEGVYAREYYRCVTDEGMLLWVFRDGREGGWYLHGWWD